MNRFMGIDCGATKLRVAVVDDSGAICASEVTSQPEGDGHDRQVALDRLARVVDRLGDLRGDVHVAGYCYSHSGVLELLTETGWGLTGATALNDVVGIYGLTSMTGGLVVAGCGSTSQVVYIDQSSNICWPSDDVERELPEWLVCGRAYAAHLGDARDDDPQAWLRSGQQLSSSIDNPSSATFIRRAAQAVRDTRDALWQRVGEAEAPTVVLGGGAVADDRLWQRLEAELQRAGVDAKRVLGDHAAGLARYAMHCPDADPWSFVGTERPSWLR